jgi:hypothetical protein
VLHSPPLLSSFSSFRVAAPPCHVLLHRWSRLSSAAVAQEFHRLMSRVEPTSPPHSFSNQRVTNLPPSILDMQEAALSSSTAGEAMHRPHPSTARTATVDGLARWMPRAPRPQNMYATLPFSSCWPSLGSSSLEARRRLGHRSTRCHGCHHQSDRAAWQGRSAQSRRARPRA